MNREELAKKKGIKLQQNKTAAETLITTIQEPKAPEEKAEKKAPEKKAPAKKATAPKKKAPVKKEAEKKEKQEKKQPGRPKRAAFTKLSINVPEEDYVMAKIATSVRQTSMSGYITSLIEADVKENGERYNAVKKLIRK